MAWQLSFDDTGGYDCISAAFVVAKEGTTEKIVIDGKDFGWTHGWDPAPDGAYERMRTIGTNILVTLNKLDTP